MRKSLVFPIMYGWYRDASEADMAAWRQMAADFINGKRDDVPLTLGDFKELRFRETPREPDPGPACHGQNYLADCPGCIAYWEDD